VNLLLRIAPPYWRACSQVSTGPKTARQVTALGALKYAGCIEAPDGFSTDEIIIGGAGVYAGIVMVTSLGKLLLKALADVCPDPEVGQ